MRIDLDMPVSCADGDVGELADVVVDPGMRRLTHLVIQPSDRAEGARLVPIEDARDDSGGAIALRCTVAELCETEPIQDSAYVLSGALLSGGPDWDVGIQDVYSLAADSSLGPEFLGAGMTMEYDQHVGVNYHRIPKGGVELRRTSPVMSSDGHHVGHIVGFVIDDDDRITGLVLEHGHLWGKRKVAIPCRAIDRLETDEMVLGLTGDEIGALTPLRGDRHGS